MKPVLALDADGVLVDFTTPALKFINSHGRFKTLADVTNWSVFDDDEKLETMYRREIVAQPDFCRNMQAYPGAIEFGRAAQEEYTVMIVTAPYDVLHWYEGREDWMVENLGLSRKNVCFLSQKEFFDSDILVDDKVENIEKWAYYRGERIFDGCKGPLPILFDQPWNRVKLGAGIRRVTSWKSLSMTLEENNFPPVRGNF